MTELTPEEAAAAQAQAQVEADALSLVQNNALSDLIADMNAVSHNIMSQYPEFEPFTWGYQRMEAEAIIAAGDAATLDMAPFITNMCASEWDDEPEENRLDQVKAKALSVKAHADAWGMLATSWIGIKSKAQREIMQATTPTEAAAAYAQARDAANALLGG